MSVSIIAVSPVGEGVCLFLHVLLEQGDGVFTVETFGVIQGSEAPSVKRRAKLKWIWQLIIYNDTPY